MTELTNKDVSIVAWLANGQCGLSSETMAFCALGTKSNRIAHPLDPADFNRCLLLVETVPSVREDFPAIAALSPQWAGIIDNWTELETTFLEEVGLNWGHGNRAPRTYQLMQRILIRMWTRRSR